MLRDQFFNQIRLWIHAPQHAIQTNSLEVECVFDQENTSTVSFINLLSATRATDRVPYPP
jgi:hypothetical protein